MSILKFKNENNQWQDLVALRGRDGAIQYRAGANIEISSDNVISAIGLEGTVTRDDVQIMIGEAVPTQTSDLTNDSGFITNADVPSKTSDLTNDSGFITSDGVPSKTSDLINDAGFITAGQIPSEQEPAFNGSVARNITQTDINNWNRKQNPVIFNSTYNSTTNKAATMNDIPFVPTKLSDLTNDSGYALRSELPTVPTKLSDLTNDAGFITNSSIPTKTSDLTNDSNFATLSDIPTVPTKLSDLLNDRGYITQSSVPTQVSSLLNDAGYITDAYHDNTKQDKLTAGNNISINGSTISATVPTKVSDLTNDSGFIDNDDVENYVDDRIFDINILFNTHFISQYAEELDNGINIAMITPDQTIVDYIVQFVNKAVRYGNNVSSLNKTAAATFSLQKYEKPSIRVTMPMTAIMKGVDPSYSGWNRTVLSFATVAALPESSSDPNTIRYYNVIADIIITHLSTVSTIRNVNLHIKRKSIS